MSVYSAYIDLYMNYKNNNIVEKTKNIKQLLSEKINNEKVKSIKNALKVELKKAELYDILNK